MNLKRRVPFLRWSVIRMAFGARGYYKSGQWGDGREAAVADYVESNARAGDADDVLAAIDKFAYDKAMLIAIGDEKGELLDAAVKRADPNLCLELGTYVGYGALRIARAAPTARVFSVELSAANAEIARRIWAHAGVDDRVTCVVGTIGDGGRTLDALNAHGFSAGKLDLLFIDHEKSVYLTDLQSILDRDWLHPGSIVVADNILIPGAPKYRAYMRAHQGRDWDTTEHKTHAEYQTLMPDVVLESRYLGS
ncbi:MAG TPA: O-methyltransferase [Mycobacterium sp.]|nr:O-methyltransferase [Mycobacterium sp.]